MYGRTPHAAAGTALLLAGLCFFWNAAAQPTGANAEAVRAARLADLLDTLPNRGSAGPSRVFTTPEGYVQFLGAGPGTAFPNPAGAGRSAPEAATAFLAAWRDLAMQGSAALQFVQRPGVAGASARSIRFRQTYQDIPVFAAEAIVQVGPRGEITCLVLDLLRDATALDSGLVATAPRLALSDAIASATAWMQARHGTTPVECTPPALMLYDPEVVGEAGPVRLVWHVDAAVAAAIPIRDRLLIDARTGRVVFQYPLVHDALNRQIYDSMNTTADPGSLSRSEGEAATGNIDVDTAYDYFGDTYDFYAVNHGRDSLDNAGATLSGTVRYCHPLFPCPFQNAFWDGTRMYFGQGFAAADDVVAHELTHGVTQNESNLIYANQSGAINESFSDVWGEFVDLSNTGGTDTAGVRWLVGEDLPGIGAIRDMANPTAFGDPDSMDSPYWYDGPEDEGGVHTNSGVGNKLCYLLTDGDTFNGRVISGMGITAVADLFYECQTSLLTAGATYADLYFALTQAAVNLAWSQADRDNLESACRAVSIRPLPAGPDHFRAISTAGDPNISLSWNNPADAGFLNVVIRRSTSTYPADPTDGDLVYQGTGTAVSDGPLTIGTTYYYSAWAYYGGDEYSAPARDRAVAGTDTLDYFTELFDASDNDLDYHTLTLIPDGSPSFYAASMEPATAMPSDPVGGTVLVLDVDDAEQVALAGGATVSLYGISYGSFHVGSNGYITFGSPDTEYAESLSHHFSLPRVAALFDDLDPSFGGQVSWRQLPDRVAVTWQGVPEYANLTPNTFQIELFFDGTIRITWLQISAADGLAGISDGAGLPGFFFESDLTEYGLLDSDEDGLPDLWETEHGLDPHDATGDNGAAGDPDADGLSNIDEYQNGADPNDADTDDDGLTDAQEVNTYGTDPGDADTDDDGFDDGLEISLGTDPNDANSVPPAGETDVNDSIVPVDDLALPFGDTILGTTQAAQITVTNSSPTNHLLLSRIGLLNEYREDFGDGLAQQWTETQDAYWEVVANEYRADSGITGVNMQSVYTGQNWQDLTVRATLRRTGDEFATAYLCARVSNDFLLDYESGAGNAYIVGFFGEGTFIVGKFVSGNFDILALESSEFLNTGTLPNVVELTLEGTSIEVRFNGLVAWTGTDTSLPGPGRVGLACDSGLFVPTVHYFDDIEVGAPNGSVGAFQLTGLPAFPTVIAPSGSLPVDVVFEPTSLGPFESAVIIETNDANEAQIQLALTGTGIPDDLDVSPATGFAATGPVGGPFSPTDMAYVLTNTGVSSLSWEAQTAATWIDITPPSGMLTGGAAIPVTVALNANAETLASGTHEAMVSFVNLSSGATHDRNATLTAIGPPADAIHWFPLDTDPGWTTQGQWAFGTPTGQGGTDGGSPDPTAGATGTKVYGVNLNGDYSLSSTGPFYLTAGPFDCTGYENVRLQFQRWLNSDEQPYVVSMLDVSNNGASWTQIWDNVAGVIADSAWTPQVFDVSAIADGQPNVYVRWGYDVYFPEFALSFSGWNLDDVALTGDPVPMAEVWVDFGYPGPYYGTFANPVNTLGQALMRVTAQGTIKIKGDVAVTTTNEAPLRITQPVRIEAIGGAVRIGGSGN